MPSRRTKCREATIENMPNLADKLYGNLAFNCSNKFTTTMANPALDVVKWNESKLRYEVPTKSGYTNDDAILQAMVMLFIIGRMQYGWGLELTCRQLSTWCHPKKPSTNKDNLLNLWQSEIEILVANKQLGKTTLNHHDNYCSIAHIYRSEGFTNHGGAKWQRKSTSFLGKLHEISEQATIQWALSQKDVDPYMSEVAIVIIKLLCQHKPQKQKQLSSSSCSSSSEEENNTPKKTPMWAVLGLLLFEEAEKDQEDDFCKRVLQTLENI